MVYPVKEQLTNIPALQTSCMYKAVLMAADASDNSATVMYGGEEYPATILFNCQDWIYNQNTSVSDKATRQGATALCLGDYVAVLVYLGVDEATGDSVKKRIVMGIFDDVAFDYSPPDCFPPFDMGDSFFVKPFNTSNAPDGSSFPFIQTTANNDPLALVNEFTDIEGNPRSSGTSATDVGYNVAIVRRVGSDYVFHRAYEFMRDVDGKRFEIMFEHIRFAGRLAGHIISYNTDAKYILMSGIPLFRTVGLPSSFFIMSATSINGVPNVVIKRIQKYGEGGTWDSETATLAVTAAATQRRPYEVSTCLRKLIAYNNANSEPPFLSTSGYESWIWTRATLPSTGYVGFVRGFGGVSYLSGNYYEFDVHWFSTEFPDDNKGVVAHVVMANESLTNTQEDYDPSWKPLNWSQSYFCNIPSNPYSTTPVAGSTNYSHTYELDPSNRLLVVPHPNGMKLEASLGGTYSYTFSETISKWHDLVVYEEIDFVHASAVDQYVKYYIGDSLLATAICKGTSSASGTALTGGPNVLNSFLYNIELVTNVHFCLVDLTFPFAVYIEVDIFQNCDDVTPCDVQYRLYIWYNGTRHLLQTVDTAWSTENEDGYSQTGFELTMFRMRRNPRYSDFTGEANLLEVKCLLPHLGYVGYESDGVGVYLGGDGLFSYPHSNYGFSADYAFNLSNAADNNIDVKLIRPYNAYSNSGMDVFGSEYTSEFLGSIDVYSGNGSGTRRSGNLTLDYQPYDPPIPLWMDSKCYFASIYEVILDQNTPPSYGFTMGKDFYINFISPLDGSVISWSEDVEDLAKLRDAAGYATPNNTDFTF